jgi:PHD/YefM family antitoxin component YafN of YafNO toxin-antitoxin module
MDRIEPLLALVLYMLYDWDMVTASLADFRAHQSALLDVAQREPVEILSRGSRRRAVVVSPDFFDRALAALEEALDVRQAAAARREEGTISHAALMAELGL